MKQTIRQVFGAAATAGMMVAGVTAVHAGPPNPAQGYASLYDNILDKGVNFGRCHAFGSLAAKVCAAQGYLDPKLYSDSSILSNCTSLGVDFYDDADVAPCIETRPPSREDLGTC